MNVKRDASEVIADAVMDGLLSKQVNRDELVAAIRAADEPADNPACPQTWPMPAEPADTGRGQDAVACHRLETPAGKWQWIHGEPSLGTLDLARVYGYTIHYAYARPPSEAAAVDDAMVDAFAVAEQRAYNEGHAMDLPDLYRFAVRKGIEAALNSQPAEVLP